ncbi:caspase family protein [Rhodoblastus sp.]|uniref:caspase family protein n=1 Tax=Rhodoblastus sp. TaxID=1962975 RepID=UPI003F990698
MTRRARILKSRLAAAAIVGALMAGLPQASGQPAPQGSPRIALVIGEAAYKNGPLSSAANDAGLIADTLQTAGFDVTGAADLDQDGLRRALREFVDKAAAAGSNATVFIYLSGRAVQYEGENYLAPVEAAIPRAANVPLEAVRLSDYLQPLAQMPLRARIVVLDAARINTFDQGGAPLAGGLALVEPDAGELIAYNAAPGSVAPNETGPYGVYAQALTEMLREGGLPLDEAFARARLRVSEQTRGAQVPWDESKLAPAPVLFARAPGAPPPAVALETQANMRARPIRDYPVDQAYAAALEQDTFAAYVDFLNAYPNSAYAERVRVMLALRREAITWRRAWLANTPNAYWTYLQYYPRGPHSEDARLRLGMLNAELAPPPHFEVYALDVPPPVEAEAIYFNRPYVVFDDPAWGAPPPMGYLLAPRPLLVERAPPPPPYAGLLPLPLVAAPLLFAIPAVRQGLFHAPSVVTTQQPGANNYYNGHYGRPQSTPGVNTSAPGAPAGAPLPHAAQGQNGAPSGGTPLPHIQQGPNGAPAAGAPLPHPATAPAGAPLQHFQQGPNGTPPATAPLSHPAIPPGGAPAPHVPSPAAPTPHSVAPARVEPIHPAAPPTHVQPPHPVQAPHPAPTPHIERPHPAAPEPHFLTPHPGPAPHLPQPKAEPPHGVAPHLPPNQPPRPPCGKPGLPPCH